MPLDGAAQMLSGFDAAALVDTLVLTVPPGTTYNLKKVEYRSEAGRRSKARFSDVSMPAPMVFSADSGLVLYERILSPRHEKVLMDKLSKPRIAANRKELSNATSGSSGYHVIAHHEDHLNDPILSGSPADRRRALSARMSALTTKMALPVVSEVPYVPRSRAFAQRISDQEHQVSQKYLRGERATMTASTVFTWGGRFKHAPPDPQLSTRESLSVGMRRPPLRL